MTDDRSAGRPTVASFVTDTPLAPDTRTVTLGEDAAHHMRVRRMREGDAVTLRDGAGAVADGALVRIARASAEVAVAKVRHLPRPRGVTLYVPVADRDRTLWLAEKAVELGVTAWRPVLWKRSRSVSPRAEGEAFRAKVRARMAQALAQCEGAWLPTLAPECEPGDVAPPAASELALALDADAAPLLSLTPSVDAVTLAIGPEGGFEPDELAALDALGFRRARLPGIILRFETAGVVGVAFARALLDGADAPPTASMRDG